MLFTLQYLADVKSNEQLAVFVSTPQCHLQSQQTRSESVFRVSVEMISGLLSPTAEA